VQLETSDLFPNLPAELRKPIWEFSLPIPRLITVGLRENEFLRQVRVDRGENFESRAYYNRFYPTSPAFTKLHEIPGPRSLAALLFAYKQSRQMALNISIFAFPLQSMRGL
jgi:hypothetical protein